MLDKSAVYQDTDTTSDVMTVKVHICNSCDQSLFHVTSDNRILCATCCKYVYGWHALGSTLSS